ncbi:hypothetical protein PPERSA_01247 [Pseudocohnilembus persalinus]|uniref:Transmembrane protein n=1 Tax=Pseudocohnilembus persalinus TaxID=266149 RepID=A0A0V0QGU7_PSEPJ|nr:hypothetical protein PPERSA_01247 [Pseudocohnilembus persalinus]|eukprot:KRX01344.1 hypothetical protein PPERSA_01247 [Pseudocohnilembus persalinus]
MLEFDQQDILKEQSKGFNKRLDKIYQKKNSPLKNKTFNDNDEEQNDLSLSLNLQDIDLRHEKIQNNNYQEDNKNSNINNNLQGNLQKKAKQSGILKIKTQGNLNQKMQTEQNHSESEYNCNTFTQPNKNNIQQINKITVSERNYFTNELYSNKSTPKHVNLNTPKVEQKDEVPYFLNNRNTSLDYCTNLKNIGNYKTNQNENIHSEYNDSQSYMNNHKESFLFMNGPQTHKEKTQYIVNKQTNFNLSINSISHINNFQSYQEQLENAKQNDPSIQEKLNTMKNMQEQFDNIKLTEQLQQQYFQEEDVSEDEDDNEEQEDEEEQENYGENLEENDEEDNNSYNQNDFKQQVEQKNQMQNENIQNKNPKQLQDQENSFLQLKQLGGDYSDDKSFKQNNLQKQIKEEIEEDQEESQKQNLDNSKNININIQINKQEFTIPLQKSLNQNIQKQNKKKQQNGKIIDPSQYPELLKKKFKNASAKKIKKEFLLRNTYYNNFKWKYFFEFFFYHLLFYIVLGPFINLIFFKKRTLMKNLNFWGKSSLWPTIQFIDVAAIKYATYDEYKILQLRSKPNCVVKDFELKQWYSQTDIILYKEIYNSLRKYDIDESMFYLSFIVSPPELQMKRFTQHCLDLYIYHQSERQFQPEPIGLHLSQGDSEYIYGYSIIKELIDIYQKKYQLNFKILLYMIFIYLVVKSSVPFFQRWQNGKPVLGESWLELFCIASVIVNQMVANLNGSFKLHISLLRENKAIIDDISRNRDIYFMNENMNHKENFLYSKAIQYLKQNVTKEELILRTSYLDDLQESYEQFITELENDELLYPVKIGGLTIDKGLVSSFIFGVMTMIAYISYKLYLQNEQ